MTREDVIRGLECCMIPGEGGCDDCPYIGKGQCQELLGENAIALLKAQEPRVMTLEEVKAAAGHDVWLELSGNIADDVMFAATIEGCGTKGLCTRYDSLNYSAYGIRPYGWRCWTSRPDEKTKEATQWSAQEQREYEAAVEMAEYCERYEPTYNADDGSM